MKLHSILTQIASLLSNPLTEGDNNQEQVSEERQRQEGKKREGGRQKEQTCVFYAFTKHHLGTLETQGHFIVFFQNRCRETPLPSNNQVELNYIGIC